MSKINKFEDVKAWQLSRVLAKEIYKITSKGRFNTDFPLRDQIRKAAISVSSNIAEGFERNSKKEFIQFLYIAKASAGEIRSQLYLAKDLDYLTEKEFNRLISIVEETSKTIYGFIKYLKP